MSLIQYLQAHSAAFIVLAGILGLLVGSFLNVVIHRLPIMMEREWRRECAHILEQPEEPPSLEPFNLVVPRSRCPECGHAITAMENIPVLSYLFLRGRCAGCGCRISWRYPMVEALSGLMAAVAAWHFGFGVESAGAMLLGWALIALSFIDFDRQYLPDSITLPFLWFGLCWNLFGIYAPSDASLIGAMAGYGILWCVYHLFKLATGKEGMGFGDFKLLAMLGAWLGWQALPVIIVLSSLLGAVIGLSMIVLRGHDRNIPIPFGPYIAIGGWVALLWGEGLVEGYLRWSGYR